MAIFCLVLATAAFVLVGGPQACRCEQRSPPSIDTSNDGFDGNIWKNIRDRLLAGDGNNLISAAKPPHDIAPTFTWNVRPPTGANPTEPPIALQLLINRYRKYMVERFVRFDDACSLLFGDGEVVNGERETTDNDDEDDNVVESNRSAPMDGSNGGALNRQIPLDLCSRDAKHHYRCLLERLNDRPLMEMLQDYLETYCAGLRHDNPFDRSSRSSTVGLQKRDTPRYVSKQKFHSWGGKRNTAQVFYPWGGKRTMSGRTHKQPKVVIRNPFHSWGGKRSDSGSSA